MPYCYGPVDDNGLWPVVRALDEDCNCDGNCLEAYGVTEERARRIAAALEAVEGLPTEALEQGYIALALKALAAYCEPQR